MGGAAIAVAVAHADAASPRFGLGSVLTQGATQIAKVASAINGVPLSSGELASLIPGQEVTFTITGRTENADGGDVIDVFDSSLSYITDTGDCFPTTLADIGGPPPVRPASIGGVLICSPVLIDTQNTFSFQIIFEVVPTAQPHTDPNFNVSCVEATSAPNSFTLCDPVAGVIRGGPPPVPTRTPTVVPFVPLPPLPSLPPPLPPLPPPPPPPAPLLPPPPVMPPAMMAPPAGVPVIPEADSALLLLGGLLGMGGLVGLAAWRRRRDGAEVDQ
jgi:hypothetical protein